MHEVLDNLSQRPVVYLPNNSVRRSSIDQHVHSETWLHQHCRDSPFASSAPSVGAYCFRHALSVSPVLRRPGITFSCIHYLMNKTFNTVSDAVPEISALTIFSPPPPVCVSVYYSTDQITPPDVALRHSSSFSFLPSFPPLTSLVF